MGAGLGRMKIIDVKTIRLRATIPTEGQVFSRSGVRNSRSATLVQIETDQGITGLGSCSGNGELIEVIVGKVLKPLLVGMDPTQIDEIWDKAYVRGGHKEFGTRGIGVVALSGIDIALWDILGKVRGLPIYQLLGGKCRDRVPVYATALYPEEPSKVAKRARAFAEQGFHGVKIKVGFDLDQDIGIVRAVRQELGKDFTVMTDANQGYNIDVGLKAAEAFSQCGVFGSRSRCLPKISKAMRNSERKVKFPLPSARTSIPTMRSKISSPGARLISSSPMSPVPAVSRRSERLRLSLPSTM